MKKSIIAAIIIGLLSGFVYWKYYLAPKDYNHGHHEHTHEEAAESKLAPENQAVLDEIIVVHDEAMPKMGRITELEEKMKAMAEKTKDKKKKATMLDLAMQLSAADNKMFGWMEKFKPLEEVEQMNVTEAAKYLQSEREKVNSMRDAVNSALKNTEDFILKDIQQ